MAYTVDDLTPEDWAVYMNDQEVTLTLYRLLHRQLIFFTREREGGVGIAWPTP
jgi:hypothetical protein